MEIPAAIFPFDKFVLPRDETLLWTYYNRTFHRPNLKGIAITSSALYLCSALPFLFFLARWHRYPFADIRRAKFRETRFGRPGLFVQLVAGTATFHTPYDAYQDEMDYDRQCLAEAAQLIESRLSANGTPPNNSFKPKPLRGSA